MRPALLDLLTLACCAAILSLVAYALSYGPQPQSHYEGQRDIAPVRQDVLDDIRRELQRQAITNPWQGYQPQMPGANK